ncbi:Uncharacterized protein involved in outer membrane biogenesis [Porphyromonas macacae]|uniref:Uncharacterized protein involved in outer membrane biogenesis n=2 Tax=Porphyromonas macacae TaxID=28115 RepID=A0A379E6W7_9PORP|nr:translocation/assembly module TamB domain-containing protein [Porphyromonas macacae]SUB88453.1 Uncharacterized protein involved in outer membrane biogenesis [Porphyromonas macacae]
MNFFRRHWKRIVLTVILLPFIILLLAGILLYTPSVQQWAVKTVSEKLSESTGMLVSVKKLNLKFPAKLRIEGVSMLRSPQDTLLIAEELQVRVDPLPLINNRVKVPLLNIREAYLNLPDSTGQNEMKIRINGVKARNLFANLKDHTAQLGSWEVDGGSFFMCNRLLSEKEEKKEESKPLNWRLQMDRLGMKNIEAVIDMPLDSLLVDAHVGWGEISRPAVDLSTILVTASRLILKDSRVTYATDHGAAVKEGMDFTHLVIDPLSLEAQNIRSEIIKLDVEVVKLEAKDRSGLEIRHFSSKYHMDEKGLKAWNLVLRTGESEVIGRNLSLPWGIFNLDSTAMVKLDMDASVGMGDLRNLSEISFENVIEKIEDERVYSKKEKGTLPPIEISANASGTVNEMNVKALKIFWPSVMDAEMKGKAVYLTDNKRRRGAFNLEAGFQEHASTLLSVAGKDVLSRFHIPSGTTVSGNLDLRKDLYKILLDLRDRNATMTVDGNYMALGNKYAVNFQTENLDMRRFMPFDSLGSVSVQLEAYGYGFDLLNTKSSAELKLRVDRLEYKQLLVDSLTADGRLNNGALFLALNSENTHANIVAQVDAILSREEIDGSINLDVQELDLQAIGISTAPLNFKTNLLAELRSDMQHTHRIDCEITDARINFNGDPISPERIDIKGRAMPDSTSLDISSGDMFMGFRAQSGLKQLLDSFGKVSEKISAEIGKITEGKEPPAYLQEVIPLLPGARLNMSAGRNNALWSYLRLKRISFQSVETSLSTSPLKGLQAEVNVAELALDTTRISRGALSVDTRMFSSGDTLTADNTVLDIDLSLDRRRYRNQSPLHVRGKVTGSLRYAVAGVELQDDYQKTMHRIGLRGEWDKDRYELHFLPEKPVILAYAPFTVNADNEISLNKQSGSVAANLRLTGEKDAFLSLQTNNPDSVTNDINLIIQRLDLKLFERWKRTPPMSGTVFADVKVVRTLEKDAQPVITGDLSVSDFAYDGKELGHIGSALFYEPRNDRSHYITAEISHNRRPSLSVNGIYRTGEVQEALSGDVNVEGLPLAIANPFIGKDLAQLSGTVNGKVKLGGTMKNIDMNGAVDFDDVLLNIKQYGSQLRLDTIQIPIKDSKLFFNHFAISPERHPDQAVYVDGYFTFLGKDALTTDLRVKADEVEITNSKRTADKQALFGRLIASADLKMTGRADKPRIRGSLDVLGGTNVTYVMQAQGLNTDDKMSDVIVFTDFRDTLFTPEPVNTTELGGLDIAVSMHIDPAVIVNVDLGTGDSDKLSVIGGGDLSFSYPPYGEMSLLGTYRMSGGSLKYNLGPLFGAKEFTIDPKSYVQFNGKPENPYLHFTALHQLKANVSDGTKNASRRVEFIVSIKAREFLEKLKLNFDVDAPADLMVRNILSGMNEEERGKQAIALMATGSFMPGQGTSAGGGLNFNGALSGLLQSSVNKIFGKVLEGTSFNLGMERNDGLGGATYTNYTYSFSHSFYNDRIRAIVGGKVQSGNAPTNKEQTFIDNAALEYQVDKAGTQYLKLFHQRVFDNLVDGEIAETGFSYVIRRKLDALTDLFRFRRRPKPQPESQPEKKPLEATEPIEKIKNEEAK